MPRLVPVSDASAAAGNAMPSGVARAFEDAAEHVAAEVVGAEQMRRAHRPEQIVGDDGAGRIWREHRADHRQDKQGDDDQAATQPVADRPRVTERRRTGATTAVRCAALIGSAAADWTG